MGLAVGQIGARGSLADSWRWYLFAAFAANAADLDFLPGLLVGDMNAYHHAASHSLGASVIFGLAAWLVAMRFGDRAVQFGVLGGLIYSSHVLVDYITSDSRSPYGIPVLWPFSDEYFISPVIVLGGIKHGVPGDDLWTVMGHIFSWHNLMALTWEAMFIVPVFVATWWIHRTWASARG